jgi:DNA polymerase-3 subunit gamma/tau
MALLRVMHAADMPDPGTLAKKLEELAARGPAPAQATTTPSSAPPGDVAPPWEALVTRVERAGQLRVAQIMRDWVRVVAIEPEHLRFSLVPGYSGDPAPELRDGLLKATGARWQVEQVAEEGAPALRELTEAVRAASAEALRRDPLVEATFAAFPGAELLSDDEVAPLDRNQSRWSRN